MLRRIVTGGQTGVDRAALDAAIRLGIEHGGWCPRGRRSEDGPIPLRYQLTEADSVDYPVRTERNVMDSDATLILFQQQITGGTQLTRRLAKRHGKPYFLQDLDESMDPTGASEWLAACEPAVLNVAGPRESTVSGVYDRALEFMIQLLGPIRPF